MGARTVFARYSLKKTRFANCLGTRTVAFVPRGRPSPAGRSLNRAKPKAAIIAPPPRQFSRTFFGLAAVLGLCPNRYLGGILERNPLA